MDTWKRPLTPGSRRPKPSPLRDRRRARRSAAGSTGREPRLRPNRWTVIVFNGNAGIGPSARRWPRLPNAEFAVLLFDYRGYGGNPGSPSEEGLAADARAARRYLAGRGGKPRIVYFGESLGRGVAVRLAAEQPPSALILRSPFTRLPTPAGTTIRFCRWG